MSTPAAAIPAIAISQSAWPLTAISCPRARITRRTSAFVTRAPLVTTSAPSAAVTFVEPSLRQSVHVAAEAPASIANRTADVSTKVSLGRQSAQRFLSRPPAHGAHQYAVVRAGRIERRKAQRGPGEARADLGERALIHLLEDLHGDDQAIRSPVLSEQIHDFGDRWLRPPKIQAGGGMQRVPPRRRDECDHEAGPRRDAREPRAGVR